MTLSGMARFAASNDTPGNVKTRPWLPDGRSLHLNTAEAGCEGVLQTVCDSGATMARSPG
jgi:hypothetical protein